MLKPPRLCVEPVEDWFEEGVGENFETVLNETVELRELYPNLNDRYLGVDFYEDVEIFYSSCPEDLVHDNA